MGHNNAETHQRNLAQFTWADLSHVNRIASTKRVVCRHPPFGAITCRTKAKLKHFTIQRMMSSIVETFLLANNIHVIYCLDFAV